MTRSAARTYVNGRDMSTSWGAAPQGPPPHMVRILLGIGLLLAVPLLIHDNPEIQPALVVVPGVLGLHVLGLLPQPRELLAVLLGRPL